MTDKPSRGGQSPEESEESMEYFKKRLELQLPPLQAALVGMVVTFCGGFLLGLVALYA